MVAPRAIDSFEGEYEWLSNFYPSPIRLNRLVFPSVEHAYQAHKTDNMEERRAFTASKVTPSQSKRMGKQVALKVEDWDRKKLLVMRACLKRKFEIPVLRTLLLRTGNARLVEGNWWGDVYWGVCRGKGENMLGKELMRLRDILRRQDNGS